MEGRSCFPSGVRGMPLMVLLGFLIVCGSGTLEARQAVSHYDELLLVRGLAHEIAVAKLPLPWGRRGVYVDAKGEINQGQAAKQLREKGESIRPGMPVEITGIKFKPGRIQLALNGGGKSGEHWWQHLEIGMGPDLGPMVSQDNPTTPSNGAYLTLSLPPHTPNPTVDQVKTLLSEVLDFSRHAPTVLYSPAIPPQFKEAIKKHEVVVGMDHAAVLSAKGAPDRKIRQDKPDGSEEEDWLYGQPPHVLFVVFNDGLVVKVHQY